VLGAGVVDAKNTMVESVETSPTGSAAAEGRP
jgi:hypothetical protein